MTAALSIVVSLGLVAGLSLLVGLAVARATRELSTVPVGAVTPRIQMPEDVALAACRRLATGDRASVPEARCQVIWSYDMDMWVVIPAAHGSIGYCHDLAGVERALVARMRGLV